MVALPVSRDWIGWPTNTLPVSRGMWTVKCGRSAAVSGPPGTRSKLVATRLPRSSTMLIAAKARGVDGAVGDETGNVDARRRCARVLAPDVAGDGVGAVDRPDAEFLERDREVGVAVDRGGHRLAPLEARLRDHGDPHQRDGGQAHAGDDGVGAGQPARLRPDATDRGFDRGHSGLSPAALSWPAAALRSGSRSVPAPASSGPGIGEPLNSCLAASPSSRAVLADRCTRALSVAIPVFAYICR